MSPATGSLRKIVRTFKVTLIFGGLSFLIVSAALVWFFVKYLLYASMPALRPLFMGFGFLFLSGASFVVLTLLVCYSIDKGRESKAEGRNDSH